MNFLLAPPFGTSVDGLLAISTNTTDAPIGSAFSGSSGALTGSGTNASFAVGQVVFIHQTQGTGAGNQMYNVISSYSAGTIGFYLPLNATYGTGAQILVVKQYSQITIDAACTLSAKAWNGTVGGYLKLMASGRLINNGAISGNALGFRGGTGTVGATTAGQGESSLGVGGQSNAANGAGGGGGDNLGGNGLGGAAIGTADLTTIFMGGGGGSNVPSGQTAVNGGIGGGIVLGFWRVLDVTGSITSGGQGAQGRYRASGAGSGGSILVYTQQAIHLGSNLITALGGANAGSSNGGGTGAGGSHATVGADGGNTAGGAGGNGRIAIAKCRIDDAGTTNPTYHDKGYQTYCGLVGRG